MPKTSPVSSKPQINSGTLANHLGRDFEKEVELQLVKSGLRSMPSSLVERIDANDGAGLLAAAYAAEGLFEQQSTFRGVVYPQMRVPSVFTYVGTEDMGRRDFVIVIENGRIRDGVAKPLTIHLEVKCQESVGSADEKAERTIFNVLAGRAAYGLILWSGEGAVPQLYDLLHEASMRPAAWREVLRCMAHGKPDGPQGPTQLFCSSNLEGCMAQLSAIMEAEAAGQGLTYARWHETQPDDGTLVISENQGRRKKRCTKTLDLFG